MYIWVRFSSWETPVAFIFDSEVSEHQFEVREAGLFVKCSVAATQFHFGALNIGCSTKMLGWCYNPTAIVLSLRLYFVSEFTVCLLISSLYLLAVVRPRVLTVFAYTRACAFRMNRSLNT